MENSPDDYFEHLARWYELRDRLDQGLYHEFQLLEDAPDGQCGDCARHSRRWEYGSLTLCKVCVLGRLRVRQLLEEQARGVRDFQALRAADPPTTA